WSDGVTQTGVASSPATRSNVAPTTTTVYSVTAVSDSLCTGTASTATATITVAPAQVTAVIATATAANTVHVTWQAVSGATQYVVLRATRSEERRVGKGGRYRWAE